MCSTISKRYYCNGKTLEYKGVYHVIGGLISQSKGILPEDLKIKELLERINKNIEEVIIATNPTLEGETTALYLDKLLKKKCASYKNSTWLTNGRSFRLCR